MTDFIDIRRVVWAHRDSDEGDQVGILIHRQKDQKGARLYYPKKLQGGRWTCERLVLYEEQRRIMIQSNLLLYVGEEHADLNTEPRVSAALITFTARYHQNTASLTPGTAPAGWARGAEKTLKDLFGSLVVETRPDIRCAEVYRMLGDYRETAYFFYESRGEQVQMGTLFRLLVDSYTGTKKGTELPVGNLDALGWTARRVFRTVPLSQLDDKMNDLSSITVTPGENSTADNEKWCSEARAKLGLIDPADDGRDSAADGIQQLII